MPVPSFLMSYTSPPDDGELPPPPHEPEPLLEEPLPEFLLSNTSTSNNRPSKRIAVKKKFSRLRAATIALSTSQPMIAIHTSIPMSRGSGLLFVVLEEAVFVAGVGWVVCHSCAIFGSCSA